jgi:small subunit ribosomal protein S1
MTAEKNLGKEQKANTMQIQDHRIKQDDGPIEPDEGWWDAVLADEPLVEEVKESVETHVMGTLEDQSTTIPQTEISVDWEKIKSIFNKDEIIQLDVVGFNRGGILVTGENIHGFVPASHLVDLPADLPDNDRESYLSTYLDKTVDLKIIEYEREKERIVFSERAALAKEGQRKYLLNNLNEGDIVSGIVTNVTSFGAFVDLGGLEGLIHISELSWGRVKHPTQVLSLDDHIQTMVLHVSEDEGRIALSLKRLQENPWKVLADTLSPDDVVEATISSIVNYGAFAEIESGIEGLIHITSMDLPEDCRKVDDFLYEGQHVLVRILSIDAEKRRLGLHLESCLPDHG